MYETNTELNVPYAEAMARVVDAITAEKLGIVSEVHVHGIMKKKMDKDIPPYSILGACAPDLAMQAIEAEPNVGALLPCNVVVRESGEGKTTVSFLKPESILGLAKNSALDAVEKEAAQRIQKVFDRLAG
ncbi:MAG TPA: DUF302 domain-containing protein [Gammaproteobacteria bacterium]|nr:DUF302 domain-containing protein [Gammaproteobacteria bacterium]